MTVVPVSGSAGEVAVAGDGFGDIGFDDINASDLVIPRIKIVHRDGVFQDNLSNATIPTLDCIVLGLVKQRIMWDADVEDDERPMCKSPDGFHGFPNISEKTRADKRFPWDESNFDPSQLKPLVLQPGEDPNFKEGWNSNGQGVLPCTTCKFTNWETNPKSGKNTPPRCTEQYTFAIEYWHNDAWTTALVTFQKTGIKPARSFISSFAQSRTPMFAFLTRITLTVNTRGSVEYSVPTFVRGEATDRNNWQEYADKYTSLRSFLRAAPAQQEAEDSAPAVASTPEANVNTAPPAAPPAPAAAPPAPPVAAPPAPPAPPVAAPPVAAPPAPPAPPVAAPPAPPAPPVAAPPAPPAPPAAPAPAATQTVESTVSAPAPTVPDEDDDLPF